MKLIVTTIAVIAFIGCFMKTFTPADDAQIGVEATAIASCQAQGIACKADGGKDCYAVYDACMKDGGLR